MIVFPELWGSPIALGYGFDSHLDGDDANPLWFEEQNKVAAEAIHASDKAIVPCGAQAWFPC